MITAASIEGQFDKVKFDGLNSHVLLAGCKKSQTSKEDTLTNRGFFTSAFITLFESKSINTLTYKDAIEQIPALNEFVFVYIIKYIR
jgi:hypothetical protein